MKASVVLAVLVIFTSSGSGAAGIPPVEGKWCRHKSHARAASPSPHSRDTGQVQTGCHAYQAAQTERLNCCRFAVLPQGEDCQGCLSRSSEVGWKSVPFCGYAFSEELPQAVGSKLAAPTGFEPVLPP
jgi:hypothetical protein